LLQTREQDVPLSEFRCRSIIYVLADGSRVGQQRAGVVDEGCYEFAHQADGHAGEEIPPETGSAEASGIPSASRALASAAAALRLDLRLSASRFRMAVSANLFASPME